MAAVRSAMLFVFVVVADGAGAGDVDADADADAEAAFLCGLGFFVSAVVLALGLVNLSETRYPAPDDGGLVFFEVAGPVAVDVATGRRCALAVLP